MFYASRLSKPADIDFTLPLGGCAAYFSSNPPNSGEFGYAPNQPLGVSPRFPSKPTRSVGEGSPLTGPRADSPRGESDETKNHAPT